jgi:hypothetical protein
MVAEAQRTALSVGSTPIEFSSVMPAQLVRRKAEISRMILM